MYSFTSESVSDGHPDKIADLISDTIADYILAGDETHRAAVETLVTTNTVIVAGEYKRSTPIDNDTVESIIRHVIDTIGYEQEGFDWKNVDIDIKLHGQSADIALGTDDFGAGDQGLMFGYACKETPEYMPLAVSLSHSILEKLKEHRKSDGVTWLGPDAKAQVTVEYEHIGKPVRVSKVVCSTQHSEEVEIEDVRSLVKEIILPAVAEWVDNDTEYFINPTGRFVVGGPDGDTGLTGRKIIVDTYGGHAPHGGGAFSGKDCTKVDRSAAYMARYLAKNVVANGLASNCTVQLSYAIGVKEPTSFYVYADGKVKPDLAYKLSQLVDLTPKGIIDRFNLFNVKLTDTTNYGHFGKEWLPWEEVDLKLNDEL